MNRLLYLILSSLGGWLGWMAGERVGFMTAVILSFLGSLVGIYAAWRVIRDYLES